MIDEDRPTLYGETSRQGRGTWVDIFIPAALAAVILGSALGISIYGWAWLRAWSTELGEELGE